MFVLPEPVIPCNKTVFEAQLLISLMARFWAGLSGLSGWVTVSRLTVDSLIGRRFFAMPRGRTAWTTADSGQR